MNEELTNDIQSTIDKIKKKSTFFKWGAAIATLLLLVPFIWFLVYAVLGLASLGISLAAAGAVGYAIYCNIPSFIMKMENRKVSKIMEEANKNPIPTLWVEHSKDEQEINEFSISIEDYTAEIENCRDKAEKLSKDLKPEDLKKFESDIALMEEDLFLQEQDLNELRQDHQAKEVEIRRASAIWDLSMAVSKASAKNLSARRNDTLTRIKKETALDAVSSAMNKSKAQLRTRINSRKQALSAKTSDIPYVEDVSVNSNILKVSQKERAKL